MAFLSYNCSITESRGQAHNGSAAGSLFCQGGLSLQLPLCNEGVSRFRQQAYCGFRIAVRGWNAVYPIFLPFILISKLQYLQYLKIHNPSTKQLAHNKGMSSQPRVPAVWKHNAASRGNFFTSSWYEDGVHVPTSPSCHFFHLIPHIPIDSSSHGSGRSGEPATLVCR